MKDKPNNLKSTLKQKVSLQNNTKDVSNIEKQIKKIHNKNANSDIVLTTIHLPGEIHAKIKMHCAANGISFKEFVTQALMQKSNKLEY